MTDGIPVQELRRRYPYVFAWGSELGSNLDYMVEQARWAYRDGAPADALSYSDWEDLPVAVQTFVLSRVDADAPAPEEFTVLRLARPYAVPYRVWWRVASVGTGARRDRVERNVGRITDPRMAG